MEEEWDADSAEGEEEDGWGEWDGWEQSWEKEYAVDDERDEDDEWDEDDTENQAGQKQYWDKDKKWEESARKQPWVKKATPKAKQERPHESEADEEWWEDDGQWQEGDEVAEEWEQDSWPGANMKKSRAKGGKQGRGNQQARRQNWEEEEDWEEEDQEEEDWGETNKKWRSKGKRNWGSGKGKGKGNGKGKGKGKGKRARDEWEDENEDAPEKYGDTWEQPREDMDLPLLGEMAPAHVKWQYVLQDESRRSYAGFLPAPLTENQCRVFFNKVAENTSWKQPQGPNGPVPRKTAWMTKRGCNCTYRYGGLEVESQEFPPFQLELLRATMPLCGLPKADQWPDSCNLNLYDDGGSSVGWHSDDERLFQGTFRDIRIVSLSFGQRRKFELRTNWPEKGEGKRVRRVVLGDGDLMTMEGMTQKHFMHRVPKEACSEGPRINLTWRWILKHNPKCPAGRKRQ